MFGDSLSFFFSLIIVAVFIPVYTYSIGYMKEHKLHYSTKSFWFLTLGFIFSMLGVVLASDSLSFIVFWEMMSLFSFFLVIYEYKHEENIKSGITYFIMTHISGLCLMLMFGFLYKYTGKLDFNTIVNYTDKLHESQKLIILFLALLGYGAKAGLVPLHAWLPKAHPSAPSNISALMSGVMLKVALYGFIRITLMMGSEIPEVFSYSVIIIGALTAIFSIYNGLFQNNIKKLLAYSSSENIGIIFSAFGLSLLMLSYGFRYLGVLALTAALFHILNHSVFKSLLFLSAGSVVYSTGTKNMNELGGLHRNIPFTAVCAFIGTAAIAAIPPLNGFASEILILRSFIESSVMLQTPASIIPVIGSGIIIALTGGAVIWASVKAYGITFLGEPRTEKAKNAKSIPTSMNIGMGMLSLYAILLGVLSPFVTKYVSVIASELIGLKDLSYTGYFDYEITIIAAIIGAVVLIILAVSKALEGNAKAEVYDTWGCGFGKPKPFMQYSSSGFPQPISRIASGIIEYRKEAKVKDTVYLKIKVADIIEKHIYSRIVKVFASLSEAIVKLHYGKVQIYISYIFISLIVAILIVAKFV